VDDPHGERRPVGVRVGQADLPTGDRDVAVSLGVVVVAVLVTVVVVLRVRRPVPVYVTQEREPQGLPACDGPETQRDEDDRDDRLEPGRDAGGNAEVERQEERAECDDRDRVADAPDRTRRRRSALLLDERRDGGDVVGLEGVPDAEGTADEERGFEHTMPSRMRDK
jgi:hypothetical protein